MTSNSVFRRVFGDPRTLPSLLLVKDKVLALALLSPTAIFVHSRRASVAANAGAADAMVAAAEVAAAGVTAAVVAAALGTAASGMAAATEVAAAGKAAAGKLLHWGRLPQI